MSVLSRSARTASIATACIAAFSALAMLVPVLYFIFLVAVIFLLSPIDGPAFDVGKEVNGFFDPNALGYLTLTAMVWILIFVFSLILEAAISQSKHNA